MAIAGPDKDRRRKPQRPQQPQRPAEQPRPAPAQPTPRPPSMADFGRSERMPIPPRSFGPRPQPVATPAPPRWDEEPEGTPQPNRFVSLFGGKERQASSIGPHDTRPPWSPWEDLAVTFDELRPYKPTPLPYEGAPNKLVEDTVRSRNIRPDVASGPRVGLEYPEGQGYSGYYQPPEPYGRSNVQVVADQNGNEMQRILTHELAHYYTDQNRNRVSLPDFEKDVAQSYRQWPRPWEIPRDYLNLYGRDLRVQNQDQYIGDSTWNSGENYAFTAEDFAENPNRVPRELWPYFEQMFDMDQMRYYPLQAWEGTPIPPPTPPPTPYPWR